MAETLPALLQRVLRDKFSGVKSALAAAIHMTASPLGKAVEGSTKYFGPEACLRLAKATDEPASYVLRVAGKAELADLIEELYGKQTISPADRQLLERWHALTPKQRETFTTLMRELLAKDQPARKTA